MANWETKKVFRSAGFLLLTILFSPSGFSNAAVIFISSWNTATGTSDAALSDGGVWLYEVGGDCLWQTGMDVQHIPQVFGGGPGGNNYLNIPPACWQLGPGAPGWGFRDADTLGDPDEYYIRFYFRPRTNAYNANRRFHWFMVTDSNMGHTFLAEYMNPNNDCGDLKPTPDYILQHGVYDCVGLDECNWGRCETDMWFNQWHRFESHIYLSGGREYHEIRLDGVDVTSEYDTCFEGCANPLDQSDMPDKSHDGLWIAVYDAESDHGGIDVCCIEVRDDTWPGPVNSITNNPSAYVGGGGGGGCFIEALP